MSDTPLIQGFIQAYFDGIQINMIGNDAVIDLGDGEQPALFAFSHKKGMLIVTAAGNRLETNIDLPNSTYYDIKDLFKTIAVMAKHYNLFSLGTGFDGNGNLSIPNNKRALATIFANGGCVTDTLESWINKKAKVSSLDCLPVSFS